MRTCSQAHLPITHSSMSFEPVPIAHISEVDNIEEDLPSQETLEVEEEIKPKVQAKSSVVPVDNLVSAWKSFGGSSSKAGNIGRIREPEPFSGKDPTKLKAFLFQCRLYFQGSSDFEDRSRRVTFALSYLQDVAQEWFEPRISGDEHPQALLPLTHNFAIFHHFTSSSCAHLP